jgi:hypothetical protein
MDTPRDPRFAARLFGAAPERRLALLRAAWPSAVGPELARRTELVALDREVLRVRVPDAPWQRILFRMRGQILGRLRSVAGDAAPRALGFVQGGTFASATPPALPPAPPVESEPPASVTSAAQAIPDAELRALFLRSAGRYFGRFGGR